MVTVMNVVFPMYVGVILFVFMIYAPLNSIPHVCGGDPDKLNKMTLCKTIYPMYVGVILMIYMLL